MSKLTLIIFVFVNIFLDKSQSAIGDKKPKMKVRSEGSLLGHYLFLPETSYMSTTPSFFMNKTANELECKCLCSKMKQCISMTYRLSDSTCSLYANDPCDTRYWQTSTDMNFYINIKRLKYRLFQNPEHKQPLNRLTASSLCSTTSPFNSDKRWLFAFKINGRANVNFQGLDFNNAPNQVAPSPWYTMSNENIWNSILMNQWNSHLYFPKYFGFALIYNGTVREFVYFRLHKTTIENFFNKQHTPITLCWNLKSNQVNLHQILEYDGYFKRLFSISINGNISNTIPCHEHQTFMYISPQDANDKCLNNRNSYDSIRILFSDECHPMPYSNLLHADALIGLTSGETTTDT